MTNCSMMARPHPTRACLSVCRQTLSIALDLTPQRLGTLFGNAQRLPNDTKELFIGQTPSPMITALWTSSMHEARILLNLVRFR